MWQGPQAVNGGWQMLLQAKPPEADHIAPVLSFLVLLFVKSLDCLFCHLVCFGICVWEQSKNRCWGFLRRLCKKYCGDPFLFNYLELKKRSGSINMFPLNPKRLEGMNRIFILHSNSCQIDGNPSIGNHFFANSFVHFLWRQMINWNSSETQYRENAVHKSRPSKHISVCCREINSLLFFRVYLPSSFFRGGIKMWLHLVDIKKKRQASPPLTCMS